MSIPAHDVEDLQRRLIRPLLWSAAAAMLIYGASIVAVNAKLVLQSFVKLGWMGWSNILALSLVNYGLRWFRWELYLRRLKYRIPTAQSLACYLGGFAFTPTPGKAGEVVRSLYLRRLGVTYSDSLAAFFAERLLDLVAIVVLVALAVQDYRRTALTFAFAVITLLLMIRSERLNALLRGALEQLEPGRLRSIGSRALDMLRAASQLLELPLLCAGLLLALLAWSAQGVAFAAIINTLGLNAPFGLAIGMYAASLLAGVLSFIPGGLGSTEAVMVFFLVNYAGADAVTAVAATIICQLATLWFAVIIGTITLAVLECSARKSQIYGQKFQGQRLNV